VLAVIPINWTKQLQRRRTVMKRIVLFIALTGLLGVALAACGGGGGGGGAAAPAAGTFTKEAFKVTGPGPWPGVFDTSYSAARVQNLYSGTSGSNRLSGAGYITKVGFKAYSDVTTAFTCTGVTLKMGHTSLSALTSTYANNVEQGRGSMTTVVQDKIITIPTLSAGDFITIDLTTPFYYNGADNLVIDYTRAGTCGGGVYLTYDDTATWDQALFGGDIASSTGQFLDPPINTKFTFAGGDNAVELGGSSSSGAAPFGSVHWRLQTVYLASEVNGKGPITGFGMKTATTTTTGAYTYTLKLGHTTLSRFTSTFADNYTNGSPVTVVSNQTFTIPGGVPANTYIWIPFPGTFTYNGTDDLLVDLDVSNGIATNSMLYTSVSGSARVAAGSTGSSTANIGMIGSVLHAAFRFNGGRVMVLPNVTESASDQVLGNGTAGQIQSIYESALLGTSGTIENVYVRLSSLDTPTAASLTNYKLYMGHTAKTTLSMSDTYASNMDGMTTVFSGTLTIPAGLKSGDWVKIPLSHTFAYDASTNLSVLFTTDAGPVGNVAIGHIDDTLFPSHSVGSNDNVPTTSGTPNWYWSGIVDLALDIAK
jgi:hypothetical protein